MLLLDEAESKLRREWSARHYDVSIVNVHGAMFRIHDDEEVSLLQVVYTVISKKDEVDVGRSCTTRCLLISESEEGRQASDSVIATRFIYG